MPASTPEEIYTLFTEYFSAADVDSLITLYEPGATLVPQPGVVVSGHAAIREALGAFLALKGEFKLQAPAVFQAGDIALLFARWTLKGTDPSGNAVELAGQTSDVIRKQDNGAWLFVIDNPNGVASVV
jgi:ketosteroid isomerase-like protein